MREGHHLFSGKAGDVHEKATLYLPTVYFRGFEKLFSGSVAGNGDDDNVDFMGRRSSAFSSSTLLPYI